MSQCRERACVCIMEKMKHFSRKEKKFNVLTACLHHSAFSERNNTKLSSLVRYFFILSLSLPTIWWHRAGSKFCKLLYVGFLYYLPLAFFFGWLKLPSISLLNQLVVRRIKCILCYIDHHLSCFHTSKQINIYFRWHSKIYFQRRRRRRGETGNHQQKM